MLHSPPAEPPPAEPAPAATGRAPEVAEIDLRGSGLVDLCYLTGRPQGYSETPRRPQVSPGGCASSDANRNLGRMRLLVPAASAALIAVMALSVTAAVPVAVPVAGVRPSSVSAALVGSTQVSSAGPALTFAADGTGTTTFNGANTAAASTTRDAPPDAFAWPLPPRPAVLRRFQQPRNQWSPGHRGVDLLAAVGQPVLSAGDGIVAFSGVISGRGVITVRHSGGLRTTYEPVDGRLPSGTLVNRGAPIGVLSPTPGHCVPGHCLHWGAISGQTYHDPLSLLGFGRPILLPLG